MKRVFCVLLVAILLAGCASEGRVPEYTLPVPETTEAPSTEPSVSESMEQPVEWREYATYPVRHPSDNVEGNKYYYPDSARVCYYDFDLMLSVTLCSQPNCKHNDESCNAFIAPKTMETEVKYIMRDGLVYAFYSEGAGNSIKLITLDPVTGERHTLMEYDAGERYIKYLSFTVDGDVIYYQYTEYGIKDNGTYERETIRCYVYDIPSGQSQLIQESVMPEIDGIGYYSGGLLMFVCTENFYLYEKTEPWTTLPMHIEEYVAQGNDLESYYEYCMTFAPDSALYIVNRKTGEERYFAENTAELRIQDIYSAYCDKKMSFVRDDTFYIYDGRTGEITELFHAENVGYQALADGRIIYNTYSNDENGETVWTDHWYDLSTGEHVIHPSNHIAVMQETETHFITTMNTFISKQDYYNGCFDNTFR